MPGTVQPLQQRGSRVHYATAVLAPHPAQDRPLQREKKISDWDHALGLYVVGRIDAKLVQINSAIVAERRLHQLRVASIEALLTLAEMMERFDVTHEQGGRLAGSELGFPVRRLAPDNVEAWARVVQRGYEGYVAKDEASAYEGGPTRRWLK